jgi:hypothetical protein
MAVYMQLVGTERHSSPCALVRFSGAPAKDEPLDGVSRTSGLIAESLLARHPVVIVNLTRLEFRVDGASLTFSQFNWMAHDFDVRASVYKRGKVGETYVVEAAPPAVSWRARMQEWASVRRTVRAHFRQESQLDPLIVIFVPHPHVGELRDLLHAPLAVPPVDDSVRTLETYICVHDTFIRPHEEVYADFERSIVWPQLSFDDSSALSLDKADPICTLTPGLKNVRAFVDVERRPPEEGKALSISEFSSMHFFGGAEGASVPREATDVLKYLFGEVRKGGATTTLRLSVPLPSRGWGSRLRLFPTDGKRQWLNAQHHLINCATPALGSTTFNVTVLDRHKPWSVLLLLELTSPSAQSETAATPTLIACRTAPLSTVDELTVLQQETEAIERVAQTDRDSFVTALLCIDRPVQEYETWVTSWSIADAFGVASLFVFMRTVSANLLRMQSSTIDGVLRLLEMKRPRDDDLAEAGFVNPSGDPSGGITAQRFRLREYCPPLPTRDVSQLSRALSRA